MTDPVDMSGKGTGPGLANEFILTDFHDTPYSPLRRVPEVSYSISGWFQSVP